MSTAKTALTAVSTSASADGMPRPKLSTGSRLSVVLDDATRVKLREAQALIQQRRADDVSLNEVIRIAISNLHACELDAKPQ